MRNSSTHCTHPYSNSALPSRSSPPAIHTPPGPLALLTDRSPSRFSSILAPAECQWMAVTCLPLACRSTKSLWGCRAGSMHTIRWLRAGTHRRRVGRRSVARTYAVSLRRLVEGRRSIRSRRGREIFSGCRSRKRYGRYVRMDDLGFWTLEGLLWRFWNWH